MSKNKKIRVTKKPPDPHKIVWLPFGYHMPVLYERRLLADFRPVVGQAYGSRMVANQIRADRADLPGPKKSIALFIHHQTLSNPHSHGSDAF
jgi:hypothetical protein